MGKHIHASIVDVRFVCILKERLFFCVPTVDFHNTIVYGTTAGTFDTSYINNCSFDSSLPCRNSLEVKRNRSTTRLGYVYAKNVRIVLNLA